jgi:hypothetical protein
MPTVNVERQLLSVLEMTEHRDLLADRVVDVALVANSVFLCVIPIGYLEYLFKLVIALQAVSVERCPLPTRVPSVCAALV